MLADAFAVSRLFLQHSATGRAPMGKLPYLACAAILIIFAAVACTPAPESASPAAAAAPEPAAIPMGDPVEGLRSARRVGCTGCHEEDGRGGGFDQATPQGDRFVAPNLSERRARYDDAGIAALLREGSTHDGHRAIGMPIHMFQYLSDQEVSDITAWVRALPAIANPDLPPARLSETTRRQLQDGAFAYNDDDQPDPGNQPPATRPRGGLALGEYLAMTSCPECHGRDLNGWGPDDPAPSLIVAKAYTPEAFMRLMRTGITSNGKESATGFMSGVARRRFAVLTDDEVLALKLYLDSR